MTEYQDLECKTLWIGDVQPQWDERFIMSLIQPYLIGEPPNIKLIRDKITGFNQGYGFLEFTSRPPAERVLEACNGMLVPGTNLRLRLNWGAGGRRMDQEEHSVFVGDLSADVTDALLYATFSARFSTVRGAKVIMDQITGASKGFGFVRFTSKEESEQAIATMNGVYCTSRPMRVSAATTKRNSLQSQSISDTLAMAPALNSSEDASNTTVFVGGIDQTVTEDQLKAHFSHVGEVVFVKIPPGRGCAFIQFANHYQALSVIQTMNGTQIGPNKVRLGWGKAPGSRSAASAPAYGYPYQQGISGYQYPYYGQYYQHQQSYDPYQQTGYQNYGQVHGYTTYGTGSQSSYYQQTSPGVEHEMEVDFTQPDNVQAKNRAYISRNVEQLLAIEPRSAYDPPPSDVTVGTAMAGN